MQISISSEVTALCPKTTLGVLCYEIDVEPSSPELLQLFDDTVAKLCRDYSLESVTKNPHIASTRQAYKAFGKSPSEYRNAAEAMLRRITKGNGLYHVNNAVEINNLVSVSSGYSVGSYDMDELRGDITLRRAEDGAHYEGIGKGSVNIEHLPVLYDELGPFGNPSSDSRRAMMKTGIHKVLSVVYSFDGREALEGWTERYSQLLNMYCQITSVDLRII